MPPPILQGNKVFARKGSNKRRLNISSDSRSPHAAAYPNCGRAHKKVTIGHAVSQNPPTCAAIPHRAHSLRTPNPMAAIGGMRQTSKGAGRAFARRMEPLLRRLPLQGTDYPPTSPRQRRPKGLDAPADGTTFSAHPATRTSPPSKQERRRHPRCHRPFFGEKVFRLKGSS